MMSKSPHTKSAPSGSFSRRPASIPTETESPINRLVRLPTDKLSSTSPRRKQHPSEQAEVDQPDAKEEKWKAQPQTAALPGGSGAAQPLSEGFVRAPDNAPLQSPELDASEDREGQADCC